MGRQGRFGKYGDIKRKERLRKGSISTRGQHQGTRNPVPFSRSSGGKVFIRDAVESDNGFIKELSKEAFDKYGPYEEIIPEWVDSGLAVVFVACSRKKSLGFGMISRPFLKDGMQPISELLAIAVARGAQGRGIGSLIVIEAEERALEMGAASIVLHAAVGNTAAQRLFNRQGFVSSLIKGGYYPNGQEAIMMVKHL